MKFDFLLDTSAFRALSKDKICQLKATDNNIFVSPYSFWEILCHLDENEFERNKGHLLKFDYVTILDDPRAEFEKPILINNNELVNRISDKELINGLLNALENSSTLHKFYSSFIKDSKGQIRLISECSHRVREILDKEEKKYAEFQKKIIGAIKSGQAKVVTLYDYNERILELINGNTKHLIKRGARNNRLADEVLKGTYIYYSYIFYRALNNSKVPELNIDQNDYEDAHICLHLTLDTNYHLITSDNRMKAAVEQIIFLIEQINYRGIHTKLKVNDITFINSLVNK